MFPATALENFLTEHMGIRPIENKSNRQILFLHIFSLSKIKGEHLRLNKNENHHIFLLLKQLLSRDLNQMNEA